MADCPYCRIISGELEGKIVYQDDLCSAFMNIQPINPGHILLVPNQHTTQLEQLAPETAEHLFRLGRFLAQALLRSGITCQGTDLYLADGRADSLASFHVHLHIIPRFADDGFEFQFSPRYAELPTNDELEKNAFHIKQALRELTSEQESIREKDE